MIRINLQQLALATLVLLGSAGNALATDLDWRVSIKVILSSTNQRPNNISDADIREWFDDANLVLDSYGRGYRFNVTEIVNLSGVSQWYNSPMNNTTRTGLETAALASPTTYAWRTNSMNLYIVREDGGGWCARPTDGVNDLMIIGAQPFRFTAFHEAGHHLGLCHTHGCTSSGSSSCVTVISDDIDDTLGDNSCWDQDDISINAYGALYSDLTTFQADRVDDVWQNIMSYHTDAPRLRLTPDQLDRMVDTSNDERNFLTNGRTWFVDASYSGTQTGSSTQPSTTIVLPILAAADGDIIMIRPGAYSTSGTTITQNVILRATRGNAILGASN